MTADSGVYEVVCKRSVYISGWWIKESHVIYIRAVNETFYIYECCFQMLEIRDLLIPPNCLMLEQYTYLLKRLKVTRDLQGSVGKPLFNFPRTHFKQLPVFAQRTHPARIACRWGSKGRNFLVYLVVWWYKTDTKHWQLFEFTSSLKLMKIIKWQVREARVVVVRVIMLQNEKRFNLSDNIWRVTYKTSDIM